MSAAATIDETAEPIAIAQKPAYRTYLARREGLRLNITRSRPILDDTGQRVDVELGSQVGFRDGVLKVPLSGLFEAHPRLQMLDGAAVIKFLEGDEEAGRPPHHLFGNKEEGFWRLDEPAPEPTVEEETLIVEYGERGDITALEAFVAHEETNWRREKLLQLAEGTLTRVKARLGNDGPEDDADAGEKGDGAPDADESTTAA